MNGMITPDRNDVRDFIRDNPFATVVSHNGSNFFSTSLPLIWDPDSKENVLIGHMSRRNPHVQCAQKLSHAVAIFRGVHNYISASWFRDRTQAPTWNHMSCEAMIDIQFDDNREATDQAVELLTRSMEHGRSGAWEPCEMNERYDQLIRHIIPFRATVLSFRPNFKLSQKERKDVFEDMIDGLNNSGNPELAQKMTKYRAD